MSTIRRMESRDTAAVGDLLTGEGLPTDDTGGSDAAWFVAEENGGVVGTIGLECYPPAGLLRSAAVSPSQRGRGTGRELVAAVVAEARARGLSELLLLTTGAEGYFLKAGFTRIERESIPEAIAGSPQFTQPRCSSAAVMRLPL